jgi:hypothetical protein
MPLKQRPEEKGAEESGQRTARPEREVRMPPASPGARGRGGPAVVPYVVPYEGELAGPESDLTVRHTVSGPQLAYFDEQPGDREAGVLWARMDDAPGVGEPRFPCLHSGRQRECMRWLKCQVCGQPAGRNEDGYLFLEWRKPGDPPTWPEGVFTSQPPVCDRHARTAMELCPHAPHFVMLRSRLPRLWGVLGAIYRLTGEGWVTDTDTPPFKFGDPQTHAVLASNLVRQLTDVTIVPRP